MSNIDQMTKWNSCGKFEDMQLCSSLLISIHSSIASVYIFRSPLHLVLFLLLTQYAKRVRVRVRVRYMLFVVQA